MFNLSITVLVSALTQPKKAEDRSHRDDFHDFIADYTKLPPQIARWKKPIWLLALVWFLFAIGPFAVMGNQTDPQQWAMGIPTIWLWQVAWWIVGCIMMYLLAFKLQMSTVPDREVTPLNSQD